MNQYYGHQSEAQKDAGYAYDHFMKNRSDRIYKPDNKEKCWLEKIKKWLGISK